MEEHIMEMARQLSAQAWCAPETEHTEMDAVLAEQFARILAAWLETCAQSQRNTDFYRGLLDRCAEAIGKEAYTSDDGTIQEDPLRLKIPEIVLKMVEFLGDR